MKTEHEQKRHDVMVEGAKRYAAAHKSDPFAMARCMAHIRSGVAEYHIERGRDLVPAYYDAAVTAENRTAKRSDGTVLEWEATVYRNIAQP